MHGKRGRASPTGAQCPALTRCGAGLSLWWPGFSRARPHRLSPGWAWAGECGKANRCKGARLTLCVFLLCPFTGGPNSTVCPLQRVLTAHHEHGSLFDLYFRDSSISPLTRRNGHLSWPRRPVDAAGNWRAAAPSLHGQFEHEL